RRSAPPHWKPAERRAIRLPRCVRAGLALCMLATCCSAISAAATGWISLASGPAVNFAARLEKLAGRFGRTILASEDFVGHRGDDGLQLIGRFAVAGFAAEQMVYGLADERKDAP